ncbi:MAG: secondary thiamine-phosphate synthase enzyme YjbQ [Patescibacteria group bacterium]
MVKISVSTKKKRQALDITDIVNKELQKQNFKQGLVNLFLTHTTAAITTADLDPGTEQDYLDAFEKIVPKLIFNHPHDPSHTPDHILSSLIGTSLTLPVENGKLVLGSWQRVVLIEFNGPKEREVVMNLVQSS